MLAQLPPALQNLHLPLRLRLWDGHEFNLGPAPSVTIVVKDPQMVSQFTHPSLDLLGAAFVEGKLELEGSISDVIRVCDEWSQALLNEDDDNQPVRTAHDKATDAAAISCTSSACSCTPVGEPWNSISSMGSSRSPSLA